MSRLFVAIEIPEQIREKIYSELSKPLQNVKKVEEKNLHLTLCFIGEADEEKSAEKLEKIGFEKFEVKLGKTGKFGERVLWAEAKSQGMEALAEKISGALGVKDERGFSGHLTLARAKQTLHPSVFLREFEKIKGKSVGEKFLAEKFVLMKSELTPMGPVYSVVKEFPAKGG